MAGVAGRTALSAIFDLTGLHRLLISDELVSEMKQVKSFVTYTMRKDDVIDLLLLKLDIPSEQKMQLCQIYRLWKLLN
ncbi:hypothetical protein evm_012383 [Chilo suppressalis]|nr:hypothetical protein evm_012383 [Chilo suppressalis]